MSQNKIWHKEYVKQISIKTGYAQKDVAEVLKVGKEILKDNLIKELATTIMDGIVVYPATYKRDNKEVKFARARFGKFFRNLDSAILE